MSTPEQRRVLTSLIESKDLGGLSNDDLALTQAPLRSLTQREASGLLDTLLAQPRKVDPEAKPAGYDDDLYGAAMHFAARARMERLQLAWEPSGIYHPLGAAVKQNKLDQVPEWPAVLREMIDLFFDEEYRHGDKWCWQEFCGVETFPRLMEYRIWKRRDARLREEYEARREEIRAEQEIRTREREAHMRAVNEERHAAQAAAEPPKPERKPMSEEEVFGENLELTRKRREERRKRLEAQARRNFQSRQRAREED